MNKKMLLIPTAAVSAALAFGSIAYACTTVQGTTTVTSLGGVAATCTTQNNPQTDTNCDINISGGASRQVIAHGTGARANTAFYLWFLNFTSDQDSMRICMAGLTGHAEVKMWDASGGTAASSVSSNGSGAITSTTRYIPSNVHPSILEPDHGPHSGTASVCWMDNNRNYATDDVTIAVTA